MGTDDVSEVIKEEKSRLKPAGKAAERKHAKRARQCQNLLDRGTEEDVIALLRSAGLDPDSPEGQRALKIWRENRR